MIGTLAVDGWNVTCSTERRGLGWAGQAVPNLVVPKVTAHPSTANVPTSFDMAL